MWWRGVHRSELVFLRPHQKTPQIHGVNKGRCLNCFWRRTVLRTVYIQLTRAYCINEVVAFKLFSGVSLLSNPSLWAYAYIKRGMKHSLPLIHLTIYKSLENGNRLRKILSTLLMWQLLQSISPTVGGKKVPDCRKKWIRHSHELSRRVPTNERTKERRTKICECVYVHAESNHESTTWLSRSPCASAMNNCFLWLACLADLHIFVKSWSMFNRHV